MVGLSSIGFRFVDGLGQCPAASSLDIETGAALIFLNASVFPRLPEAQQRFVAAHEIGHMVLCTHNEAVADAFALGMTAGRSKRSLKEAVRVVGSMAAVPANRLQSLLNLCYYVDPKN